MEHQLGVIEILGLAASLSLLAGWRLYLCLLATGIAMRMDALPLPDHLAGLAVLANPWVMGVAGFAAVTEFFADKIAWLDSVWDLAHTVIRPVGGALLALAILDPSDPAVQVIVFILGGGAALLGHGGKVGARALVNTSPEPFSNIAVSSAEDVATGGLVLLAFANPAIALLIALAVLAAAVLLLWAAWRVLSRISQARGTRSSR